MRILALLAGLMLAGGAAAQAVDDAEITVTARLKQVSLTLGRDDGGRTTCSLARSSGDVRIDGAICKRAAKCIIRGPIVAAHVDACVERQKTKLAADWAKGARS